MIRLTRLNGGVMHLNADLVATVESHHDTVVTLVDGKHYVVLDTAEEVVDAVRDYRASVLAAAELLTSAPPAQEPGRLLVLRAEPDAARSEPDAARSATADGER